MKEKHDIPNLHFQRGINNGYSNTDRKTLNSLDCTLLPLINAKDLSHIPSRFTWRSCAILREALAFYPSLLETAASRQRVKFRPSYQHLVQTGSCSSQKRLSLLAAQVFATEPAGLVSIL